MSVNYELCGFSKALNRVDIVTKERFCANFPRWKNLINDKYEDWIGPLGMQKVKEVDGIYYCAASTDLLLFILKNKTKEDLENYLIKKGYLIVDEYIIEVSSVDGKTYWVKEYPNTNMYILETTLSAATKFKNELEANNFGNKLGLDIDSTWKAIPVSEATQVNTEVKLEVGYKIENKYLNKTKWGIVRYDAHPEIDGSTVIDAIYFKDQDAKNKWIMASEEKNTLKVAPKNKVFAMEVTRVRMSGPDTKNIWVGTIDQLRQAFSYTLECGQSWEHERGNKKVNTHPTNIKSLVSNLDKASANSCRDYQDHYYEEIDLTDELYEKWVSQQADNPSSYSERIKED